ncbi:kirola-like [Coffea eugenioides]|uniref:Kirola n=1 Tax=Coffea arabica TaxID=13443 RepID=A0A6P6VDR0_COFAR|nr:kirola-like [Coffea arabica]XP_027153020.1 kirola-like [Coffea eugenioides]
MGLKGKMIGQTNIHGPAGDVFHDAFSKRPHHLATMTPEKVQGFTLLGGDLGTVGSKICWHYTHDGKDRVAKQIIQDINEEKKSIVFKMIEGDLMELYKTFTIIYHVDVLGDKESLITWTLDYEKLKEDTPHPGTLLNFFLHMVEDIESHHIKNP